MVTSRKSGSDSHKMVTTKPNNKQGWNLVVDKQTHEALAILGEYMMRKDEMHDELKKSLKIPKSKVIKILALEKLEKLKLVKKSPEAGH